MYSNPITITTYYNQFSSVQFSFRNCQQVLNMMCTIRALNKEINSFGWHFTANISLEIKNGGKIQRKAHTLTCPRSLQLSDINGENSLSFRFSFLSILWSLSEANMHWRWYHFGSICQKIPLHKILTKTTSQFNWLSIYIWYRITNEKCSFFCFLRPWLSAYVELWNIPPMIVIK